MAVPWTGDWTPGPSLPVPITTGAACGVIDGEIILVASGLDAEQVAMFYNIADGMWRSESKGWQTLSDPRGVVLDDEFVVFTGNDLTGDLSDPVV